MTKALQERATLYKLLSAGFLFPDEQVAGLFAERDPRELVSDYNRVFLGDHPVPPYECEFSCRSESEKARHLADIAGFYRAFAVEVRNERPDHISSELEFLHLLVAKEIEARRTGNAGNLEVTLDAERKFFREHLSSWTSSFSEAVRRQAPPGSFYADLCTALEAFLQEEAAALKEDS
jgi:TorA maturation chaperone TorD